MILKNCLLGFLRVCPFVSHRNIAAIGTALKIYQEEDSAGGGTSEKPTGGKGTALLIKDSP